MSLFELYLHLGFKHIINIHGYDHVVFVLVLCSAYEIAQIRKVLILITAFTIGHSITLILSTLRFVFIPAPIIEFLIPLTILITAVANLFPQNKDKGKIVYLIVLFFGLIHGLGFSNYLKELLGKEYSIVKPLLAFNIGLEIGQIVILSIYISAMLFWVKLLKLKERNLEISISVAAIGIAMVLIFKNKIW